MDAAPEDKGEDVRREICLTLEDMGVTPESSHHSGGPGQNIIDFQHSSAIRSADDVVTYKSVVKTMGVEKRPYGRRLRRTPFRVRTATASTSR